MRKLQILSPLLVLSLVVSARAAVTPEPRTLFEFARKASVVSVVTLGSPLVFDNGGVLAFPAKIDDLVHAPAGAAPDKLTLMYDVPKEEKDNPYFKEHDAFLAPFRLLPEYSSWREKLPNTRRYEVYGGRRYVFRGDDIAEVKQILGDYLASANKAGAEREAARVVVSALNSRIPVVREDSAKFLSSNVDLARDFEDADVPVVARYLGGEAPFEEKVTLVDALTAAKKESIKPALAELGKRDDAVGAVALHGLASFGEWQDTDRLIRLLRSTSMEMRCYAAEGLGRRAATDDRAMNEVKERFVPGDSPKVIDSFAAGLAQSGGERVIGLLNDALLEGGETSVAAGTALATIGGPQATAVLKKTLEQQSGPAANAAANGLYHMENCSDCSGILEAQYAKHPDPEVRTLLGIMLGVRLQHKH